MGLLDTISGWFASDPEGSGPVFLLDGSSLLNSRSGYRPSPRDMIGLLYRLGRFAEKEKIRVTVIFEGDPLHKAADGDEFQGVTVYYADSMADRRARLSTQIKQGARKGRLTVVCGDEATEREAAAAGAQTLRASTFRKAMEIGGEGDGPPQDNRPRREDNRGGQRRRRGGGRGGYRNEGRGDGGERTDAGSRPPNTERPGQNTERPGQNTERPGQNAGGPSGASDVRHLVDLVE